MSKPFVLTIDGPAGAGKGTVARILAVRHNFAYLDTGILYRAVAAKALAQKTDNYAAVAAGLQPIDLQAENLRDPEITAQASIVAAIATVRAALLQWQRDFAAHPPDGKAGVVLDGRDAGTVVCPNADVKIFLTASLAERARRRWQELQASGSLVTLEAVTADMATRDARDSSRASAPLIPALDAHTIDTSNFTIEQVVTAVQHLLQVHKNHTTGA